MPDEKPLPEIPAADLPYRPRDPQSYRPGIGLIGCGGITRNHLKAYRKGGYNVVALCDINRAAAEKRRQEFYPDAAIYTDYIDLLKREDIQVVDVATHPPIRPAIIKQALESGRHVLSQKPFVLDLEIGRELASIANKHGVQLAVNQNGRWAPHFSYIREALKAGLLGKITGIHASVHWDHSWLKGTPFEDVHHVILYDYAIHWFDIVACLMRGHTCRRVYASTARAIGQTVRPPLLGQAMLEYDDAQVSLAFDAFTPVGSQDRTFVAGTRGSASSVGPGNRVQALTITTSAGVMRPHLEGCWFPDGFHGTMGELLCAIEEGRTSTIDAADNLRSLELCFAAVASAESGQPVVPGTVQALSEV